VFFSAHGLFEFIRRRKRNDQQPTLGPCRTRGGHCCGQFLPPLVGTALFWRNKVQLNNRLSQIESIRPTALDFVRLKEFAFVLGRRLTPEQLASAWEEWELVCEQHGWDPPGDY
jgi:hypothetical protein